jgi:PilZ domain
MSENRNEERVETGLKTLVQVKESNEETWKEIITVTTVSRSGASFMLSRPCTVGQLAAIVLPMPPELRAYDKDEKVYPVLGLVQYCNKSTIDDTDVYHVGVAFIGKRLPDSYRADPRQSYRITGMGKNGLWTIQEAETQFTKRSRPRYWMTLDVTISLIKKEKQSTKKEDTVTQNIGERGASVFCSLEVEIGEKVKFGCKDLDFHTIAVVRNRKELADDRTTLHLEFVDDQIPIEKIFFYQMSKRVESI